MSAAQQEQLFSNIAEAMDGVPERIKARQLAHFYRPILPMKNWPGYRLYAARGVARRKQNQLALDHHKRADQCGFR